jgi:phosphopantetheine adenylyltransferase
MFTSQKLRLYLFAFLAFCVFSSKHIIIYNEETLVALSFFLFVFFVSKYFGNTITDSLNERSQVIQQELQNFLNIKEHSFQELLSEHKKVSGLVHGLKNLTFFTTSQLQTLNSNTQKALTNIFIDQIQSKLKTLAFSKLMLQQQLQFLLSENILSNVLVAYQLTKKDKTKAKGSSISHKTVQSAIDLLLKSKQG